MTSDKTRQTLLEAAFSEIHQQGFQAASINAILHKSGVTKGALYHHFKSKNELGYAVLDEWIQPYLISTWIEPLQNQSAPPLERLKQTIKRAGANLDDAAIRLGCPLNNLAQEMSPIDEAFRHRTDRLYQSWQDSIAATLAEAQRHGVLRNDLNPADTALFILAAMEGCMSIAKSAQSRQLLLRCGEGLLGYLDSLSSADN
jgi:AcrR family transcriptional regulator